MTYTVLPYSLRGSRLGPEHPQHLVAVATVTTGRIGREVAYEGQNYPKPTPAVYATYLPDYRPHYGRHRQEDEAEKRQKEVVVNDVEPGLVEQPPKRQGSTGP